MLESKRIKTIRKYLSKDERLTDDLIKITKLYKENPQHYALSTFLNTSLSPIIALKFMILLQTLMFEDAINNEFCINLLKLIQVERNDELQKMVSQKCLSTYKLFLQKLCHLKAKEHLDKQKEVIVYEMINLILMVQPLSQLLYKFGRYFSQQYRFIIDFNIILAKDLRQLYKVIINNIEPNLNKFLLQIQAANQILYPIFFNNYFHRYASKYQPKFINFDIETPIKKHQRNNSATKCHTDEKSPFSRNSNLINYLQNILQIDEKEEYIVGQFITKQQEQKLSEAFRQEQQKIRPV